jgi:hypothetical protein
MVVAAAALVPGSRVAVPEEDGAHHWRRILARIGDSGSLLLSCTAGKLPDVRDGVVALGNPRVRTFVRRSRAPANGIQVDVLVLTRPQWLASADALRVVVADFKPAVRVVGIVLKPMFVPEAAFTDAVRARLAGVVSEVEAVRVRRSRVFIVSARVAQPAQPSPPK